MEKAFGILLHPVSLPNDEGIGTIGKESFEFIDKLKSLNAKIWQMLPIGPTGFGDSPYASFSAFAGNPYLIGLEKLAEQGFLSGEEYSDYKKKVRKNTKKDKINYGFVNANKNILLEKAALNVLNKSLTDKILKQNLSKFYFEEKYWLDDFAFFMTIKEIYSDRGNNIWNKTWDKDLILRNADKITKITRQYSEKINKHKIIQYLFFSQWAELKRYAEKNNIKLMGDIPIFAAMDSADVWSNQDLFLLDKNAQPLKIAGVPPDFFSPSGQLWGNPLYNWEKMQKDNFAWWKKRIAKTLQLFDIIRIDHFRGFESCWSIPANSKTAQNGEWIKVPGEALFSEIKKTYGSLPVIAEDLGVITDEVRKLRDDFNFPGMKILQFAFDKEDLKKTLPLNPYLPHNYSNNCVVYTGTHDNNTLSGWVKTLCDDLKKAIASYIDLHTNNKKTKTANKELCMSLIYLCIFSKADTVIIPMQDILLLDEKARMNSPSTIGANWQWRMKKRSSANITESILPDWIKLSGRI